MLKLLKAKRTPVAVAMAAALGAAGVQAQDPYRKPDDTYISISGTVASPTNDEFMLDYGSGTILVEMDDWDSYGEAHGLLDGDKVTVYGRIDDDFLEVAKIEAGSVYVENLNTFFYANSADEETTAAVAEDWIAPAPVVVSTLTLRGTVTEVDAENAEFTVSFGSEEIQVDTDALSYNPLDDVGFQQIGKGDYVSISGFMNWEFFDGQVFEATSVTTLIDEEPS